MKLLLTLALILFSAFYHPQAALAADTAGADCTSKFPVTKNGATENLLYCSNKDLSTEDDTVKRLIIVVHGTNRTASNYFGYMTSAAQGANSTDSLIIAPHFVIPGDVSDTDVLTWAENEGWKAGDPSQGTTQVGSYEAIDDLITSIIDSKKYPNLKRVIVAGHSAGGQFTHRYASGTQIDQKVKDAGMSMRYIVANPSSYLYFTPDRPVSGSTTQFAPPSGGSCSGYDTYKYGFTGMNAYMNAVGPSTIKSQFQNKNVIYLLGDQDTDPNDSDLDKNCEAEAQGAFRFERGNAYYGYLAHLYGQGVYTNQLKVVVPGVAHDNNAMFNSSQAAQYLFDDVNTPTSSTGSSTTANTVPSAVCAGSTYNVCPTTVPTASTISVQPSTSPAIGSSLSTINTGSGGGNILQILLTLLLRLFSFL